MNTNDYLVNLRETEGEINGRKWTGNDTKGKNAHHAVVRTSESPLDVTLHWKASGNSIVEFVGRYRLDLVNLLRDGYIRPESGTAGRVRLKFVHDGNGIYIRVRRNGPTLRVGSVSWPA